MNRIAVLVKKLERKIVRPLVPVCALVIILSIVYITTRTTPQLSTYDGVKVSVTGIVKAKQYDSSGKLTSMVVGDCICYTQACNILTEPVIGGEACVTGLIHEFTPPMNLGEFDFKTYYAARGIWFYIFTSEVNITSEQHPSFRETVLQFRKSVATKVRQYCPFESGTINTLLLADKSGLSPERKDLYERAGVAHFLVISGLHISAIGGFIYKLLKRLVKSKPWACFISLIVLVTYGVAIGFSVSVVRAIVMYAVRLIADLSGEAYDMMNAVCVACILTLLVRPGYVADSAFIYSYVTVFALAFYFAYVHKRGDGFKGKMSRFLEVLRIPVVIALFIAPVNLWFSFEYSLAGLFVNTLITALSAPVLLLSFLAFLFSGTGLPGPAGLFDFLLALVLKVMDASCRLSVLMPGAILRGRPRIIVMVIYYVLLCSFMVICAGKFSATAKIIFYTSLLRIVSIPVYTGPVISMLYAGQGECIAIRTGISSMMLIDAGSTSEDSLYEDTLLPFLKASGITHLEGIFISHGDADHTNAIRALLEDDDSGFRIDRIFLPHIPDRFKSGNYVAIMNEATGRGIPFDYLEAGMILSDREWKIECLWPTSKCFGEDANANSMTLLMSLKNSNFDILFTGDIDALAEKQILLSKNVLDERTVEVLKIAHHGSKSASSEEFLGEISPDLGIISAGIRNIYGHPSKVVRQRLEEADVFYLATLWCGEIDIYPLKSHGFRVSTHYPYKKNFYFR